MKSAVRNFLLVVRFSVMRMLRDFPSLIPLLLVPLLIIPILGAVFSKLLAGSSFLNGAPDSMTFFAVGLVIMFQLFGGRYTMDYVKDAFLTDRKWRMAAAPCRPWSLAMGIMAAGWLASMLQGFLLVLFTRLILGVRWGSPGVVVAVVAATALLSQLVNLALVLLTRNYGLAAAISWFYAYGSCMLGGLIIPLPMNVPFWRFMVDYGTPYSLAQTAVIAAAGGRARTDVAVGIGALLALSALLAALVALLGRRKLA
jgi:ABC-2 type transport system permease protein